MKKLKITSVTVRKLRTKAAYSNIAIEATAEVSKGEDPKIVRENLDIWVEAQITGKSVDEILEQLENHLEEVPYLQEQKKNLQKEIGELQERAARYRKALAEIEEVEIPF